MKEMYDYLNVKYPNIKFGFKKNNKGSIIIEVKYIKDYLETFLNKEYGIISSLVGIKKAEKLVDEIESEYKEICSKLKNKSDEKFGDEYIQYMLNNCIECLQENLEDEIIDLLIHNKFKGK